MSIQNILLGGGVLYWLLGKATGAAVQQIDWEILPVKLKDIRILKAEFDLKLKVKNNLPVSVGFNQYRGKVFQGGKELGQINSAGAVELPSNTETVISNVVKVKALDLITKIVSIIASGGAGALEPVEIKSVLVTSVAEIPINNKINLFYVE